MIDITSPAVLLNTFLFTGLFLSGAFWYLSLKREADLFVQKVMIGTILTYSLFLVMFAVWSYAV